MSPVSPTRGPLARPARLPKPVVPPPRPGALVRRRPFRAVGEFRPGATPRVREAGARAAPLTAARPLRSRPSPGAPSTGARCRAGRSGWMSASGRDQPRRGSPARVPSWSGRPSRASASAMASRAWSGPEAPRAPRARRPAGRARGSRRAAVPDPGPRAAASRGRRPAPSPARARGVVGGMGDLPRSARRGHPRHHPGEALAEGPALRRQSRSARAHTGGRKPAPRAGQHPGEVPPRLRPPPQVARRAAPGPRCQQRHEVCPGARVGAAGAEPASCSRRPRRRSPYRHACSTASARPARDLLARRVPERAAAAVPPGGRADPGSPVLGI
jgi:hypothetical protein